MKDMTPDERMREYDRIARSWLPDAPPSPWEPPRFRALARGMLVVVQLRGGGSLAGRITRRRKGAIVIEHEETGRPVIVLESCARSARVVHEEHRA